ncbi:MAG TPA: thiolase family protein [Novosphingobium sp.]|nr:thiolase family protein [Novosphingobium sp.]
MRNKVAVAGVGHTAYGSFPDRDEYSLATEAFRKALDDCGLRKDQVDGLGICRIPDYTVMGETLGLNPRWTMQFPAHGRMSGMGILIAASAIATGQADTIALLYANIGRSRRMNYGGDEIPSLWDTWNYTSPGAAYALMFRQHMALYGTTTRQLGAVSVAIREHACLNPDAVMKTPITLDDHEASRPIVAPLRLFDYCLINDGAVCLILTSAERARDLRKAPVLIAGGGGYDGLATSSILGYDKDCFYDHLRLAGEESYRNAGIGRQDVNALMVYDNFSPTVLFALEGLGFCGRGESGAFVESGAIARGGALPVNTDGGHLSNSYLQGWALNVEAVRQIRGEGGARQVPDCKIVQYAQGTPCTRSIIYTAADL